VRDFTVWELEEHQVGAFNRLIWASVEVLPRVWDDRIALKKWPSDGTRLVEQSKT
jgi:hypothetical protein